jgi:hypothetical protein
VLISGVTSGSTAVSGSANPNPNPGNDCITVFDCVNGVCGDGDDVALGTSSANAAGSFVITVAPPLVTGQRIFARDTCNNVNGASVIVQFSAAVPDLSVWGAAVLALALALAVALRVRFAHPRGR